MTLAILFAVLMGVVYGACILMLFRVVLQHDSVPVTWAMLITLLVATGLFGYAGYEFASLFYYALAATTIGVPVVYLGIFYLGLRRRMRNR